MEDVVLEDVSPESGRRTRVTSNNEFARALERNPLRFAFVSGHVESLCPTEREETWVLNLKRGVLSNFQNSMNDFYTDLRLREVSRTDNVEYLEQILEILTQHKRIGPYSLYALRPLRVGQ